MPADRRSSKWGPVPVWSAVVGDGDDDDDKIRPNTKISFSFCETFIIFDVKCLFIYGTNAAQPRVGVSDRMALYVVNALGGNDL